MTRLLRYSIILVAIDHQATAFSRNYPETFSQVQMNDDPEFRPHGIHAMKAWSTGSRESTNGKVNGEFSVSGLIRRMEWSF